MSHQLNAVTNSEDRHTHLNHPGIRMRRAFVINRRRTSGEDDASRVFSAEFFNGDVERDDFGIDAKLANPSSNELCVLPAEVENENRFVIGGHDLAGIIGTESNECKASAISTLVNLDDNRAA